MLTRAFSALAFALLALLLWGEAAFSSPLRPASASPAAPALCWSPSCYRTYEQVQAFLQSVASAYPGIATLSDAGLSWEGSRHLWLLRLTNQSRHIPKPAVFMVGEQRPRDIATSEVLLRYISYLVQNYGTDPDVTWLIDNRDLFILPLSNPDGFFQVYANAQCYRAKNTDNSNGCSDGLYWGVDINRNYHYQWNTGGGSPDPCSDRYSGPSALSEPESAHILNAVVVSDASVVLNIGAPIADTGGANIRYPWGWSADPPPDASGLDAFAWALARLNGTPRSSVSQHNRGGNTLISGILDDTVYGEYGIPALTMNIGASPDVACADLDALWAQQRPAFLYAAKAAGPGKPETLSRPLGPDPLNVSVSGASPHTLQVTAVLSSNVGTVERAVYKIDEPGADGAGTPMSGNFGGGTASVWANVDLSTVPDGRHLLLVQGMNNANQWGVLSAAFFTVTGNLTATPTPTPPVTLTRTPSNTAQATATPSSTSSPTRTPSTTPSATPSITMTPGCALQLFASSDVPKLIPDPGTITSTLSVPNVGPVADLDVTGLTIWHDWLGDLTVSLQSPSGTRVLLFDGVCGNSTGPSSVTLDDGASQGMGEVCPPEDNGQYKPASPLAAFSGEDAHGTWSLIATDNRHNYGGSLRAWGLRLTTGQPCYTPTLTPTVTPTGGPSTRTPTGTRTPSPTRTATVQTTGTPTRTVTLTRTPTYTHSPTPTRTPTNTSTPRPPSTPTPLPCANYSDVHPSQYFYTAVDWLTCRDIISGYADGTFRPFSNATRAQIVKMVVLGEGWPIYIPEQPTFSDVQPSDWFYGVVETGYIRGIIAGYGDGTFHPFNDITRGQLSKILVLARRWTLLDPEAPHFSDVPRGSAFYPYVETALAHLLISGYGDGTFRPELNATRGQLSKMLYSALIQAPGPRAMRGLLP